MIYIEHVDGYNKFKTYGYPIHGVIDRILWLNVTRSNSNSDAHFYLLLLVAFKTKKSLSWIIDFF